MLILLGASLQDNALQVVVLVVSIVHEPSEPIKLEQPYDY